jgi:hypothetical protein
MLSQFFRTIGNRKSQIAKRKVASAAFSAIESLEGRTLFSFAAPVSYSAGSSAIAMITADLNGDGRADLVTSNSNSTVTALLGNGDGTFGAPISSSLGTAIPQSSYTGSQAGTLTSGDFNGDGKVDLAMVSVNSAVVVLGNGDGTFQAPTLVYLGTSPSRISTGDVNGDGHSDLIAANTAGTVSVLLGNGDGSFVPAVNYAAGSSPQDVKAVDINHDGKLDLVVADAVSAGSVSTLIGNGDGTFQPYKSYAAFSAPYRMTVTDLNKDGNPDIVVANSYTSSCVTVLMGNPDGTYQPYHSYNTGSQPWELSAADVDGDGKPDLISSNGSSYQVQLNNGDGTFTAPTTMPGAGLAFAAADFNGDGTADIAGGGVGTVGVMINGASAATNISTAVGFNVSSPAVTGAGMTLPLTISAVDATGNIVSDFLGTVHLTTTDPRMSGLTYTFTAADAGTHAFATGVSLYTLGLQTLTVGGPSLLAGSETVNVTAAATAHFVVTSTSPTAAGTAATFTVSTQDAFGNASPDYTGTIHFSSSDVQAGLPADYTFTAADSGVHSFTVIFKTAGAQNVVLTDTAAPIIKGAAVVNVTPALASSLSIIGGGGHIGASHLVTVKALDIFGNLATSYNGTVHLAASDAQMVLPADGAMINGVGNFYVTAMTLGSQTLTATDISNASLSATETITGTPGDAAQFVVTSVSGGVAGTTQSVTITAYDAFGNLAVDYAGTVAFSSTDYQANLPYYTFTAADVGTHTFNITFRTAGTQSLTVRDVSQPAITSTQGGIVITAAAPATLSVGLLHGTVAGVSQTLTISARDIYGNIASSYRGTLNFSTSDTLAAMLSSYAFTAADAGTHTFSIALKSSGGQTLTVQDTATLSMTSFQRDIIVTPAAMAGFSFRTPSNVTAGTAFSVTVAAVDAFGNTVTGYTGKVHFSGPSGGGNLLPADYTFSSLDNGSHVFSVTFSSTGTQTLSVADTLNGALKGSTPIIVKTGTTSSGGATGGGGGGGKKPVV